MNLNDAARMARTLMFTHHLGGWEFAFDEAKRRFGCCMWRSRTIGLSRHLVEMNDESEVRETILHEVAHALAPHGAGHNDEWKRIARSIGCTSNRCYGAHVKKPTAPLVATCPTCGEEWERHKILKGLSCRACKATLVWSRDGKPVEVPPSKYLGFCKVCGKPGETNSGDERSCGKCSPKVFDQKFRIILRTRKEVTAAGGIEAYRQTWAEENGVTFMMAVCAAGGERR